MMGLMLLLAAGTAQANEHCEQNGDTHTCEFSGTGDQTLDLSSFAGESKTVTEVEYLIVGGGGGGGGGNGNAGGGGGAGSFIEGRMNVADDDVLQIRVGNGGSGGSGSSGSSDSSDFGDGGASSWLERPDVERVTATGGGGGARGWPAANPSGRDGGSGGGGSRYGDGGSAENGQGNTGGGGGRKTGGAGAGGGGGADGGGHSGSNERGGRGGNGRQATITGNTYAAGGGGGAYEGASRGWGPDGAGSGGVHAGSGGGDATSAGSGGGGGGAETSFWGVNSGSRGGNGAEGIVVVRFTTETTVDARNYVVEENGQSYMVHEFLSAETDHEFVVPEGVTEVEYLVVGGGGAGGSGEDDGNAKGSGGGGAGGLVRGTKRVEPGEVLGITVGEGGSQPDSPASVVGESGNSSVLGDIEAFGGGGGGTWNSAGEEGGSGGGGGGRDGGEGGPGTDKQGHSGGKARNCCESGFASGGGGGGAGGLGPQGWQSSGNGGAGDGGVGVVSTITGAPVSYAGGGGGGYVYDQNHDHSGQGGLGGGGAGSPGEGADGFSGAANTGGGGGGIGRSDVEGGTEGLGGAGGSGIVIVRYAQPDEAIERPNQGTVSIPELPRIKGGDTEPLPVALSGFDGATELLAFVRLPEGGGSLAITETAGLTLEFGYDSFTGERIIGFRGARADVVTALAEHLEWTAPLNRRDVELEASITEAAEGVFYNSDNGHYYKPVAPGSDTTWAEAHDAADAAELFEMTGYLATVASTTENDFIANRVDAENLWIGASDDYDAISTACGDAPYTSQGEFGVDGSSGTDNYDPAHQDYAEGRWYWVTGPEACSQFWAGEAEGDTVAGRFARWSDGEPNDHDGGEHFAGINYNSADTPEDDKKLGFWNDFADGNTDANNYLIEFGGLAGEVNKAHFGEGSVTLRSTDGVNVDALSAPVGGVDNPAVGIALPALVENETEALQVQLQLQNDGGSFSVTDPSGLNRTEGDSFAEQTALTFNGSAEDVRAALDTIEWQPSDTAGYHDFTVTIEPHDRVGDFLKAVGTASFAVSEAPGQPSGVQAEPGNAQAMVSWDAADAGGSPITHYAVEATNGGGTHTCQTADGRETSCAVSGLSNGTEYSVTVTAVNASGTGEPSSPAVTVTPAATVTVSAPSSATEEVNDDGSVTTSYTNLDGDTVRATSHADNSASGAITLEGSNGQTSTMHFDGGETDTSINPDGSIASVNTTDGVTTRTTVHTDGRISYCQDDGEPCSQEETLPPGSSVRVNEAGELIVVEEGEYPQQSADADGTLNVCYAHDDFNTGVLTGWEILASTNYTPQIERIGDDPNKQRLRLTDVGGNRATGITKDVAIPSNGRVELDFVAHIHGGSGADGLAVVLSDWNDAPPAVGAAGGSLGYAQKSGVDGFQDGWLGIGIDSYGNYANSNEGRVGGPGLRRNAVSLRGSGSGQSGYRYLTGTPANLQPKLDGSANGHRYLVTIDATNSVEGEISVTVRRATDPQSDDYETLIDGVNVLADGFDQRAIPAQFRLSLTASTGGANNYHELSSLRVAASSCEPVEPPTITTQPGETPIQWDSSSSRVQTIDHDGEGELFTAGPDAERTEIRNGNELHFREGQPEASGTYEVAVGIQDDRGNRDSESYAIDVDLGELNETPDAPQNLTGFAGVERAALRWDFPANADDVDFGGFTVYDSNNVEYPVARTEDHLDEGHTGPWCRIDPAYEPMGCVIDGLNAAEYSFEVAASNTDDIEGDPSNTVSVTPFELAGSGTDTDPWEITNADEFELAGTPLGGGSDAHYALTDDVDLSGVDWQPIGSPEEPFTGSLTSSVVGESRNISGLNGEPLFDVIGPGAEVADLTIQGSENLDAGDNAGLLANAIKGSEAYPASIQGVAVDGDSAITGDSFIGGLAGTIEHAEINGTTIDADVTGSGDYVGGVGGTIGDSTIDETTVNGDVAGNDYVGGVGGQIDDSELRDTEVNGGVQGEGSNVGGVGGQINRSDNANCVLETIRTNGSVSGGNKTGGVGGSIDGCTVSDVEVNGDVTGGDETGGVGGDIEDSTIDGATVKGKVKGNKKTGGVGGKVDNSTVDNSTVDAGATVEGTDEVGGVGGSITDSDGGNNTVNADVTGDQNVGGIHGSETNSLVTGDASGATVETTDKGSEANPYLITEWGDLHAIRDNPDAHYRLDADLDSSSTGYNDYASDVASDGKGWQPIANFTGQLDGNDNTVTGLHIDRAGESNIALFGELGADAVIKDLTLTDVDIVGGDQTGTLAARSRAEVSNVHVSGQVEGDQRNTAGLIGLVTGGSVMDSTTDVAVVKQNTANGNSGGLIGDLVHSGDAITVENVRAEGDVTTQGGNAGGLIGLIEGDVTVRNASASGTVSGASYQGGLVGYIWGGGVEESFATGNVSGTSHLGGLIGEVWDGSVVDSYATGMVGESGSTQVGGLIGSLGGSSKLSTSYATGAVTGASDLGGLVGSEGGSATVSHAYFDSTVNSSGMDDEVYGRPTAELANIVTFRDDWSIVISDAVDHGPPQLDWHANTGAGVTWVIQPFSDGNGEEGTPYVIETAEQLALIDDDVAAHYRLAGGADATLDLGENWQPVGTEAEPFTGSLASTDGNPLTLSGLNGQPVFGEIGPGAEVSDLTIQDSENLNAGDNAGLLANAIRGTDADPATVNNINVDTDSSISGDDFIGGLAGTTEHADMTGITVDGDVSGNNDVGGVSGTISDTDLTDTTVNGDTSGNNNVGAVGGTVDDSSLTNTTTNGGVQGSGSNVGSVAGQANRSDNATCVLNTIQANGNVKGGNKTGGVGGSIDGCTVTDAQVNGDIDGGDQTGGVAGEITNGADISDATLDGRVDGDDRVGGVGGTIADSSVDSATVNGGVSGTSNVDGVGGEITNSNITNTTANGPVAQTPASGSGTEEDPYLVQSSDDLAWVGREPDADYEVTGDIDLTGTDWDPLGSESEPFTGSLRSDDGTPRAISGLDGEPLFANVDAGAEVSDLTIQGSENLDAGDNAGLLANAIRGTEADPATVNNINVDTDSSISGDDFIGGLAGTTEHADMTGITVDGDVTGNNNVGGVSGAVSDSSLSDTAVNGNVSGTGSETGGVAGRTTNTVVDDTVVTGDVSGGNQVGGVSGALDGGSASDMTIDGNVSGSGDQVGGVGGRINGADVSGGAINGDVSGNDEVGGIGGRVTDSSLSNSAVNGQVTGDGDNVGAVTGTVDDASSVEKVVTGTTEEDEPLSRVLLDEDGEPLGDGPLATGEEVRIEVDGAVLPLSIGGTVTRGTDTLDLQDDSREGVVLSDPDGGDSILTRRDGDYYFSADRGGVYELTFEDGQSQRFEIEFEVRPQVAFTSTRQLGTSGSSVTVRAVLEGTPAQYPVNVPYEVSNHDLLSASDLDVEGVFSFQEDSDRERIRKLSLTPAADTGEVRITLKQGDGPEDALLGDPFVHRVVLRQPAEVPLPVGLDIEQGDDDITMLPLAHRDDGLVTVTAVKPASGEPFEASRHSFDWSRSALDLGIQDETDATVQIDPARMTTEDVGAIRVTVTETGGTRRRATAEMRLRFIDDNDGASLDALDGFLNDGQASRHQLPICPQGTETFRDQSERTCNRVDRADQGIFMEAPESYTLALGSLSDRASWETNDFGLEVSTDEIRDEGSDVTVRDAGDAAFDHLGYRVDFELSDLDFPGQSVPVVVPVPEGEAVPAGAVWRKYADGSWRTFVEDDANRLFSTSASAGNCPWPGSDRWTEGLTEGDNCLRLIIQDGGPNDQDGEADGVIRDPGTLAVASSTDGGGDDDGETLKSSGGGGGLSSMGLMLFVLAALALLRHRRVLVLMALVMAGSAQAETDSPWYVGAQLGYGMTDVSSSEVDERLDREGLAGSARVSDSDRLGGRLFIGYQWHRHIALEAGLVDLGEITTRFSGTGPDLSADKLEDVRPGSGRGVEMSLVGRYPFADNWHLLGRAGLLRWRTHQHLEGVGADNETGNDGFFGLGVEYRFHESWSARLSVDRYRVENDDTDLIGIGVSYHFGQR